MIIIFHTVKQGETLSQIARDYRKTLSAIISANPSINPNLIYVGQRINIPGFPNSQTHSPIALTSPLMAEYFNYLKTMCYKKRIRLQLDECCLIRL